MTSTHPGTFSVIGGGIMGTLCAYSLQKAHPEATVHLIDESGFPASNASYMAGGMLAPLSELDHMPASHLPAARAGITLWSEVNAALNADFEFSQNGSLFVSHDEDRHLLERFKSILPAEDKAWSPIGSADIHALEPDLPAHKFRQGLHMTDEAHLHPQKAMHALLAAIPEKQRRKTSIAEESARADWVIDCRGMGAKDETTDLRGVKGETLVVRNPEFSLSRPLRLMHPRYPLYIVPRADHVFMIGATIIESEKSEAITLRSAMELMSALYSIHHSFGDAQVLDFRCGVRPALPDNMPAITYDGRVIHCNGLFRHGFLLAPVLAECVSAITQDTSHPYHDLFVKEAQNDDTNTERQSA